MNKKISLGLTLALMILSVTVTFAITMAVSKNVYNKIITNLSLRDSASYAIDEIDRLVSNYFYGNADDRASHITSALVEGYVNGLGDSNSRYLSSEKYADYTARLKGDLTGIGIETYFDPLQGVLQVAYVYEDSPAATAGLQQGDVISEINGTAVTAKNYSTLTGQLYGDKLSSVKILYIRSGIEYTVEPMMGFTVPSVVYQLQESYGYIKINGFFQSTPAEFENAVDKLKEQGAGSYIIDLRGTSEGTVQYAAATLDVLVPAPSGSQALATTYDKNGNKVDTYTAESGSVNTAFAVLINSATAGPAELFACDLRDISSAYLVGITTKGIGTAQKAFPLDNGDAVILSVARIEPYNPNSVYDTVGLEPTHLCEAAVDASPCLWLVPAEKDVQLTQAKALLG